MFRSIRPIRMVMLATVLHLSACGGGGGDGDDSGTNDPVNNGTGTGVGTGTGTGTGVGTGTGTGTGVGTGNPGGNTGSGQFVLSISDAVRAKNTDRWNTYIQLQLEAALKPLNDIDGLIDVDVPVIYDECGFVNAFYRPADNSVTMCDELAEELYNFHSGRTGADRPAQMANALVYILYHEIGHAFVDVLNLSVFGNEESAADGIAAVLSAETGRSFAAIIGGQYLSSGSASYGDEHTNGEDRFGDITCWAVGSDSSLLFNSSLAPFIQAFIESNRDCTTEYAGRRDATLNSVPALQTLVVPTLTNPVDIAAADPNPPKYEGVADANLATLIATTGNDFWRCSASDREYNVGYRFVGNVGQFQALTEGGVLFDFSLVVSSDSTTATFIGLDRVETISGFMFNGQQNFSAVSSAVGNINCEYAVQ